MKTFIKTAACFPHRITDDMRASVMKDFKMSEKFECMDLSFFFFEIKFDLRYIIQLAPMVTVD
ncbi:hypothetical protein ANCCAN_23861 [Ancylostoma caninum]|uniref:Uncharacterized protein n=1 Tax=Ancylostoma caninum TaxID=29170 RepID=A0A368FDW0_ANCCA|nr:hypothetical protein ANCCAN_23861 [Ancylostoma caninum]